MGLHPHSSHQKDTRKDMVFIFESPQSDMNKIYTSKKVKESEETCAQSCPPRRVYPASPSPNRTPCCQGFRAQNTRKLKNTFLLLGERKKKISTAHVISWVILNCLFFCPILRE